MQIHSDTELKQLNPLHAVYVYAHNRMDILAEQLMKLPACGKMVSAVRDAYNMYTPAFPPISPVIDSYFSCWASLDLEVGPGKESLAKIVIGLSRKLSTNHNLVSLYKIMQKSRMGLYLHEGVEGKLIILRELVTEARIKCVCPSGYIGTPGEIWFARILPEPFPWFLSIYLITQSKISVSALSLKRAIGVSYNTSLLVKHKIQQVMKERDDSKPLDAEYIQVDDSYWGGKKGDGKRGRGGTGKIPFVAAVSISDQLARNRSNVFWKQQLLGSFLYIALLPTSSTRCPSFKRISPFLKKTSSSQVLKKAFRGHLLCQ